MTAKTHTMCLIILMSALCASGCAGAATKEVGERLDAGGSMEAGTCVPTNANNGCRCCSNINNQILCPVGVDPPDAPTFTVLICNPK